MIHDSHRFGVPTTSPQSTSEGFLDQLPVPGPSAAEDALLITDPHPPNFANPRISFPSGALVGIGALGALGAVAPTRGLTRRGEELPTRAHLLLSIAEMGTPSSPTSMPELKKRIESLTMQQKRYTRQHTCGGTSYHGKSAGTPSNVLVLSIPIWASSRG